MLDTLKDKNVHVVLEPIDSDSLGKSFKLLTIKYNMVFNRKRKRKKRFFDDWFFLCLLDESHFYQAIRYVELNLFKAKTAWFHFLFDIKYFLYQDEIKTQWPNN